MKSKSKNIAINAMGIALFVVLAMCVRVPVFENFYLCFGYVAMTVYCYCIGTISGTIVGTFGVILYCLLISGLRGMPGWALGNLLVGIILGITFKYSKKFKSILLETTISLVVIVIGTAIAILGVKSGVEYFLYHEPFAFRVAKNMYAFLADVFVIMISLPIAKIFESRIKIV